MPGRKSKHVNRTPVTVVWSYEAVDKEEKKKKEKESEGDFKDRVTYAGIVQPFVGTQAKDEKGGNQRTYMAEWEEEAGEKEEEEEGAGCAEESCRWG